MTIFPSLIKKIKGQNLKIIFPEGDNPLVIAAALKLQAQNLLEPILVTAQKHQKLMTINPTLDFIKKEMLEPCLQLRKGKWSQQQALSALQKSNYFATMYLALGKADGLVGGATYSTKDTLLPAFQLIGKKAQTETVSAAMLMIKDQELLVFADCAVNPDPSVEQLASIAVESAQTARNFGLDPLLGLLSFSTNGSASSPSVKKVQEATALLKEKNQHLKVDGEMQFDAAYVQAIGQKKFPNSPVAGKVNTFIFPDLNAGNIGYKIAQRLGGYEAIGPIVQGLKKPVNDLSRGCSSEDIYKVAIITASQSLIED